ncbi:hypothetical protein SMY00_004301 [Cronobacter sakazakii]|nr:hypothetical protein [Salmonella enterica]ELY3814287.1 hypothetical protein [Cronobacter sakazakii]HAG6521334.1 hypothetical protein [Escherichia coli]HDU3663261.1 hypothetical protein [Klebsiella pneumoniae subsp. pneumoniae]EKQ5512658.1 hypothetical protein [Salmonella enterica]
MRHCNANKVILLDLLCFIAFDELDEAFNHNKLKTTTKADIFLNKYYRGRFSYLNDLKSDNITSGFMKEGKGGYLFAYSHKDESIQDLFNYVVKIKLKEYIDNTKYTQSELTNEIELLVSEFQDDYMKHFSFLNEILLFICDCYKIKPKFQKPLLIAI